MIAVAHKTYNLLFRGKREKISAKALDALNDSMGGRYASATPEMQRRILAAFVELNYGYLKKPPARFKDALDEADWFQCFKILLPRALMTYDPLKGRLRNHLIGWKKASLSRWLNEARMVRLPENQRAKCRNIELRLAKKIKGVVSEAEMRWYESTKFKIHSLSSTMGPEGDELQNRISGDDLRDTIHEHTEQDLWSKIQEALTPHEFKIWKWRHHPDYELANREIGERLGVTSSRVDQITKAIRLKLQAPMAVYLGRSNKRREVK